MFKNKFYGLPTGSELEKSVDDILQKNTELTKPLEMKEYKINSMKKLFPFWVPVGEAEYKTSDKFRVDSDDLVGSIEVKESAKDYSENFVEKISKMIDSFNKDEMYDNTGAVQTVKNLLKGTSTSEKVIKNDVAPSVEVEKSAKSPAEKNEKLVGSVKEKTADTLSKTKTDKKITETDTVEKVVTKKAEKSKAEKSDNLVGSIKSKSVDMDKTKSDKAITTNDVAPKVTVEKASKKTEVKASGEFDKNAKEKVGSVISSFNFDKQDISHIK